MLIPILIKIKNIKKKIDAIEKLHDKESLMCEEVKDLLEELRENQVEEENLDDEDFDEEEIDEDEDK